MYRKRNLKWSHRWRNSKRQKKIDTLKVYNQINRNFRFANFFFSFFFFFLALRTGLSLTLSTPWNYHNGLPRRRQTPPYPLSVMFFLNDPLTTFSIYKHCKNQRQTIIICHWPSEKFQQLNTGKTVNARIC